MQIAGMIFQTRSKVSCCKNIIFPYI
ncbi:MAG: DUF6783 domain-containing protein [Ruminococcus sp.]